MFLLVLLLLQPAPGCSPDAMALLAQAGERRNRAGVAAAAPILVDGARSHTACVRLSMASLAASGWLDARAAAPKGGAPDVLGPARAAIQTLESLTDPSSRFHNEYARAAIIAAIAAAQDERPEMSLYLTHARSLADRLALVNERAEWPLPIDELAAELWLEVDRYAEARDLARNAVEMKPTAHALALLARASDRLGEVRAACEAYRQARGLAEGTLAADAERYLQRPDCQP